MYFIRERITENAADSSAYGSNIRVQNRAVRQGGRAGAKRINSRRGINHSPANQCNNRCCGICAKPAQAAFEKQNS